MGYQGNQTTPISYTPPYSVLAYLTYRGLTVKSGETVCNTIETPEPAAKDCGHLQRYPRYSTKEWSGWRRTSQLEYTRSVTLYLCIIVLKLLMLTTQCPSHIKTLVRCTVFYLCQEYLKFNFLYINDRSFIIEKIERTCFFYFFSPILKLFVLGLPSDQVRSP